MTELDLLKAAYRSSPDNLDLARVLSLHLARTENWAELLHEFSRVHEPPAWLQLALGRAALRLNDVPRALSLLLPASEAKQLDDDERTECLALIIFAQLACGSHVAAEQALDRLLDLDPNRRTDDMVAAFTSRGLTPRRLVKHTATGGRDELSALSSFAPMDKTRNQTRFADIGGMEQLKEAARMKIILPFRKPELFKKYGKAAGGGILLYGPPGCGKTFFARAIAGECEATFFNIGINDILNMYVGNSERNVKRMFDTARASRPAILFIDELDTLGRKRDLMRHSGVSGTINAFLAELDGVASDNDNLLVIGATNAPWDIDSAFKRPGRFDQLFFVPPPDEAARAAILKLHLKNKPSTITNIYGLAEDTEHFSGADLAALVDTAASRVLKEILNGAAERPVTLDDLKFARMAAKPTTIEWIAMAKNYVEYSNEGGDYDDVAEYIERSQKGKRRIGF